MKKTLLFALTPLLFTNCTNDFYDGDTRTIIEGNIVYNNSPLQNAEVNFYPVYNQPKNGSIAELSTSEIVYDRYQDEPISISKTKTHSSGKISVSIPRNEDTSVYVIKITHGKNTKYYGYISHYNTNNYYVNLGTLNY